jgi:hypothetical protein
VTTRGFVTPLDITGHYYELNGGGSVVLIPVSELGASMSQLTGRRVEVAGLVRQLVQNQGTCILARQSYPQSYCDNPDLPPTPDLTGDRAGWPRFSITAWSILDITPLEKRRRELERGSLADALTSATPSDKPVRVVGRFCGANLCGGLGPPPDASAWALQADETAVWVVGKEPKGKGWQLDRAYRGDTSRWVEVIGRIEPCSGSRCLRARSVVLVPRPDVSPSP